MSLATRTKALAASKITKYGTSVTYRRTPQNVDEDTGIPAPGTATEASISALITPWRDRSGRGGERPAAGSNPDITALIAFSALDAASIVPQKSDEIVIGSDVAQVVGIERIPDGGGGWAAYRLAGRW